MIIAGTGHRPNKLGGYSEETFGKLVALARRWLQNNASRRSITRVLSGMALGWDQALARAATDEGTPFVACVPFAGQEAVWPAESRRRYDELLAAADDVVIVSPGGYSAAKMQVRNEYMVDRCDLLLALYDGSGGGTANCVAYAERRGKTIVNLWNEWVRPEGK